MLPHLTARGASRFFRILSIACLLLVGSYIFFEVLDLDGSNLSRLMTPLEKTAIAAEVVPIMELRDFHEAVIPSGNLAVQIKGRLEKCNRFLWQAKTFRFSFLDSARGHGYRVGLPRDSVPD